MSCLEDAHGRPALASAEQVVQGAPDVGRAVREEARESLLTLRHVDSNTTGGAAAWREQVDRLEHQVPAVLLPRISAMRNGFRAATLAIWRPTCLDFLSELDEITTSGDTDPKQAEIVEVSSSSTPAAAQTCAPPHDLFSSCPTPLPLEGQGGDLELACPACPCCAVRRPTVDAAVQTCQEDLAVPWNFLPDHDEVGCRARAPLRCMCLVTPATARDPWDLHCEHAQQREPLSLASRLAGGDGRLVRDARLPATSGFPAVPCSLRSAPTDEAFSSGTGCQEDEDEAATVRPHGKDGLCREPLLLLSNETARVAALLGSLSADGVASADTALSPLSPTQPYPAAPAALRITRVEWTQPFCSTRVSS